MSANSVSRSLGLSLCLIGLLSLGTIAQAGVMTYPGLTAVRITEVSGGPFPHFFLPASPQITNQLATLNAVSNDFTGAPTEVFDVFYSDAVGNVNINGNYVTIEARFAGQAGGGLNVAAVDLLVGASIVRADVLASFVGIGTNYVAGSELLAVDPDGVVPSTFSVMGNTAGVPGRMRVTVGWKGIQAPEPASLALASLGGTAALAFRRRRSR